MNQVSLRLLLSILATNLAIASSVQAQIIPDNTLPVNSLVEQNCTVCTIEGGTIQGANLFHSFREFSIPTGGVAFFNNGSQTQNILTRVTGTSASSIDGLIKANGTANLFFLNPNGIIFGPNARLELGGSFLASTANQLQFDGGEFSAIAPQIPSVLKVNLTPGLQYGTQQRSIVNRGNLTTGQNLTLASNNLDLQGQLQAGGNLTLLATDTLQVRDSAIAPLVARSGGNLLVQGNQKVDIFALNHPASGFFAGRDLTLRSANPINGDAHYRSGGNVRFEKLDGHLGALFSPTDPTIVADGDVSLDSYTGASLHIFAGGSVTISGDIFITAPDPNDIFGQLSIALSNGTEITLDGRAETVLDIRAGIDWNQLNGSPGNSTFGNVTPPPTFETATSADITLGNLVTSAGKVLITNRFAPDLTLPGGMIQVGAIDTTANNAGGLVAIDSRDGLIVNGQVKTYANLFGNSGEIIFLAEKDILINQSLDTSTIATDSISGNVILSAGNSLILNGNINASASAFNSTSGNVTLLARGDIALNGVAIDISSNRDDLTAYGTIDIASLEGSVFVGNSLLKADNNASGYAGDLIVNAADRIEIDSSTLFSEGYLGQIFLGTHPDNETLPTAKTIVLNNSDLSASTPVDRADDRDVGQVTLNATDEIQIQNSSVNATANSFAQDANDGGSINITTNLLTVTQDSSLEASTFGSGNAGSITVNARSLFLTNGGQLRSQSRTGATGNGGSITLNVTDSISLTGTGFDFRPSAVFTLADLQSLGSSGDIIINTGSLELRDGSELLANNFGDGMDVRAGDVTIRATGRVILEGSRQNSQASGSGIASNVSFGGVGKQAGTIDLQAAGLQILNGASISSTVERGADGQGGDIILDVRDRGIPGSILIAGVNNRNANSSGIFSATQETSTGGGGSITVNAGTLRLSDRGTISAATENADDGGLIALNINDLTVEDDAKVTAQASSGGNAGSIVINTRNTNIINNGEIVATTSDIGNAGDITIETGSLNVSSNAQLAASTLGQGNAGNITVNASDHISVQQGGQIASTVQTGAIGTGGSLKITTGSLLITDDGFLDVATLGKGDAGSVAVAAQDQVTLQRGGTIYSTVEAGAVGNSGNVNLTAKNLSIDGGAILTSVVAETDTGISGGQGNAGNVNIEVQEAIELLGAGRIDNSVGKGAIGNGGTINIRTNSLSVREGAQLSASTSGRGKAGDIQIRALNAVNLADPDSSLVTQTNSDVGQGGTITIATDRFQISNQATLNATTTAAPGGSIAVSAKTVNAQSGGQLLTTTSGQGQAGDIRVNGSDRVTLSGDRTGLFANATLNSTGNGGKIDVITPNFTLTEGAQLSASTFGQGNAGNITIEAVNGSVNISDLNSGLITQTNSDTGKGGEIRIETDTFQISRNATLNATATANSSGGSITVNANNITAFEGGQLRTTTSGSGQAGDITATVSDRVLLSGNGTGLFANTTADSTGDGGSIFLTANRLNLRSSAGVAVGGRGQGQGGNVQIRSNQLTLVDRALLSAETASAQGGNISIQAQDILFLRQGSLISSSAGTAQSGGNGGNITISAPFILGVLSENSDIRANAFTGNGGKVEITTQAIFGLTFQPKDTPRSDITASSQFGVNGKVILNTLSIDPGSGLVSLPTNLVDPTNQISQQCSTNGTANQNHFTVTGRGGLPTSPTDLFTGDGVLVGLTPIVPNSAISKKYLLEQITPQSPQAITPSHSVTNEIIEAQGWVIEADGTVQLIAQASIATPHPSPLTPASCKTMQTSAAKIGQ
ncbi:two-partner secretion domain-containing protein [Phormidesmis sp. 146-33]